MSYKCHNWTLYAVFRMICLINYELYQPSSILELCIKDSVRCCCWRRPEKISAESVTSSSATFNLGKLYWNLATIVQNKKHVNEHLASSIFYNYPTRKKQFLFFIVIIDRIQFLSLHSYWKSVLITKKHFFFLEWRLLMFWIYIQRQDHEESKFSLKSQKLSESRVTLIL